MAGYVFETITAAQALAITATDTLMFIRAHGNRVTVLYNAGGTITIESDGRAVEFGAALSAMSQADRVTFSGANGLFVGDSGENTASGETAYPTNDGIYGGGGGDRLRGEGGDDLLQGNAGADTLIGGTGSDVIYGGQDNDVIRVHVDAIFAPGGGGDFAQGNRGDDSILGREESTDTLLGGQGADTIDGAGYHLNGNLGDDVIFGRRNSGTILGEGGNDRIEADFGVVLIDGGEGDDLVTAEHANTVLGGAGNDTVTSHGGLQVRGGDGDDIVRGVGRLFGEEGNDTIAAELGATRLDGGAGNDLIKGAEGPHGRPEALLGREGADTLVGFAGRDELSGGEGADVFRYYEPGEASPAVGTDEMERIFGWAAEDRIEFLTGRAPDGSHRSVAGTEANYAERTASDFAGAIDVAFGEYPSGKTFVAVQVGADVIIFVNLRGNATTSDLIALPGRSLADISFENFI